MRYFKQTARYGRRVVSKVCTKGKALAVAGGLGVATLMSSPAAAQGFTLPDTGVDMEAAAAAVILALGGVVLVIVGGFFAFLLIRFGMQWGRKIKG